MSHTEPPKPQEFTLRLDWRYVAAYRKALYASRAENAKAIRRRILNGPADLQREIALTRKAGIATTPAELKLPVLSPDDNAMPLLVELQALLERRPLGEKVEAALTGTEKLPAEDAAALKQALSERGDVFSLIEKAASRKGLVTRTDWSPKGYFESFRVFPAARWAAKLLSSRAILSARDGDLGSAVKGLDAALRLAGLLAEDRLFISHLVTVAVQAIGVAGAGRVLRAVGPDEAACRAITGVLRQHPQRSNLPAVLEGELVYMLQSASAGHRAAPRELAETYDLTGEMLDPDPEDASIPLRFATVDRKFANDLLDAVAAASLRVLRPLVAAARADIALYEKAAAGDVLSWEDEGEEGPIDPVEAALIVSAPVFTRLTFHTRRANAYGAAIQAGAAVLAHKARTGAWPATLAEAGETPNDPWTGKPLGYRREGDGFVVWSVGETVKFTASPGQSTTGEVSFRYPGP